MRIKGGQYITKSDQHRHLRSIKLTDRAWDHLDYIGRSRLYSRGDVLQWMADNRINPLEDHSPSGSIQVLLDTQTNSQTPRDTATLLQAALQGFLDSLYSGNPHQVDSKSKRAVARFVVRTLPQVLAPVLGTTLVLTEPGTKTSS